MKSEAEELKKKYESDLRELQERCKHKDTHWCENWWAPAHPTGWEVLSCSNCWRILKRKAMCSNCGKEILLDENEYREMSYEERYPYYNCR